VERYVKLSISSGENEEKSISLQLIVTKFNSSNGVRKESIYDLLK